MPNTVVTEADLLKIIANEDDDRIPAAARFSLDVLARQQTAVRAEQFNEPGLLPAAQTTGVSTIGEGMTT